MPWNYRLMSTPKGVAVHYVYFDEGREDNPNSTSIIPYRAEAEDIQELKWNLEEILEKVFSKPILDGNEYGLFN